MAERELLRFLTAGSVDDGKSTLIGRLLYDAHGIYEDQFASLRKASPLANSAPGKNGIDFSPVTDGLREEREQGITIDVAYRYFSTPRREFIIADAPGHERYTRNMATGASTASLAVILIDAGKGILPQTRRHAAIAWLLGIRNFAVAVNKIDLVGFRRDIFDEIRTAFTEFTAKLGALENLYFAPVCSLEGDNVARRSERTPWFEGPALLEYLETTPIASNHNLERVRFPVQNVIRHSGSRRYAGQVASGVVRPGDPVLVLPTGRTTHVTSLHSGDESLECAFPPLSVSLGVEEGLDIGRGYMLADPLHPPTVSKRFRAMLVWMAEQPLAPGQPYLIKHTTRYVCASVMRINAVIDPATLERHEAATLALNEFGEVEVETHQPLYFDVYGENRTTGAFILVDPIGNATLAAGMISQDSSSSHAAIEASAATAGQTGLTVWFTGLSSAGKTTISNAVYEKLWARGYKLEHLDGDLIRLHLNKGLGFSKEDRDENVRRIGFVAELLTRNGVIVLVSAISPYQAIREEVRRKIGSFLEVYVEAPLDVCEQRDLKGIYRRARLGEIHGVTGVDDPYEPPESPDVACHTSRETLAESTAKVLRAVEEWLTLRSR